jgi:ubiquinone/menaquinone biosynthesis C-methylase UbiE
MTHGRPAGYVPAAGQDWLLPLYDPFLRWVMREGVFKTRLVREARIAPGQRVLDLGCGTATLTLLVERLHPDARVTGVDGDPKVLEIARRKVEAAGSRIGLDRGLAYELQYPDASFDRVLSSMVFHHLTPQHKLQTLREVARVLAPGGSLHVVDFGPTTPLRERLMGLFEHGQNVRDSLEGRLVDLMREAGFYDATETGRHRSPLVSLSFHRGSKQGTDGAVH